MKYDDVRNYENKRVLILLKNTFRYSGTITTVNKDSIVLRDKFKQNVLIDIDNIAVLSEFHGDHNGG